MGDENEPGGQPPAGGDGGAGGGGAPAGGAPPATPPAGGAPPPATPPRAAAPQQPKPGKGNNPPPFDQHPGFRKRLTQEVERTLRRELGISLEEAKKIIARGPAPGAAPAAGAPAPGTNTNAQDVALKEALEEAEAKVRKLKRINKRIKSRTSAELTALEMKTDAISAGVPEKFVRFAMDVYQDLWRQNASDPNSVNPAVRAAFDKDPVDSRTVFAHIRAEHMPSAGPPPTPETVNLDPSTSPPPSREPGGATPSPKGPGGEPPAQFDANKLSDAEWRAQKRSFGIGG